MWGAGKSTGKGGVVPSVVMEVVECEQEDDDVEDADEKAGVGGVGNA